MNKKKVLATLAFIIAIGCLNLVVVGNLGIKLLMSGAFGYLFSRLEDFKSQ